MNLLRSVFEPGIALYRRTLKLSRHLHFALYKIMRVILVPLTEKITNFYTVDEDPLCFRMELLTGSYEKETVKLVKQLIKPGMTVLDIGAHVGYYTKLFSKLVGNTGRVIAFEPHPLHFTLLCKNVWSFRNVTPVQVAVAEQKGRADLYDFLSESGSASLHYDERKRDWQRSLLSGREIAPRIIKDLPVNTYMVKTTTMDSWLAEARIEQVDFIKMDIEGTETKALRGMKQTIQSLAGLSMIMEFNPHALESFGVDPVKALKELQEIGFSRVMIIEDNGRLIEVENNGVITQLTRELMERVARVNLLCGKRV